jgi:hypothetical protein
MKRVEFRDGSRDVPDTVAQYLESIETYQMTYKEAMSKMNNRFLEDRVNKAQNDAVAQHLARFKQ